MNDSARRPKLRTEEGLHPGVASALEKYSRTGESGVLVRYLSANSNLPGPRANLALLEAFSSELRKLCEGSPERFWRLSIQLCAAADEFVAMCGARGVGQVGGSSDSYYLRSVTKLRSLASDPRWRVREATAMSLQGLIVDRPETAGRLEVWAKDGNWLEMRAVAAGVAEPRLMKSAGFAMKALDLHRLIVGRLAGSGDRESEGFGALRKCLAYSISVVVAAAPEEGFPFLRDLAGRPDSDLAWICGQNLKKNRLRSKFPEDVAAIERILGRGA
ncbi:MAG: hypothetical protein ABSA72_00330 [Nitrososphaerales archaeon]